MDLELQNAGTKAFESIPSNSVILFESASEGQYPQYPDATARVHFKLGETVYNRLILDDDEQIIAKLAAYMFARLSNKDGGAVLVRPELVTAVLGNQDETTSDVITAIGSLTFVTNVVETSEQVRDVLKAVAPMPAPTDFEPTPASDSPTPAKKAAPKKGIKRGR